MSIATGNILFSRAEKIFLERMDAELRHIDNVISGITGNAMMDIDMLCSDDAVQKTGPLLLKKYYATIKPTDMTKVKHYGDELAIYNLMKKMIDTHPDYVEIYIGTENGGFVTSGDYILRAGYDPRVRPWYKNGIAEPVKAKVADSYLSVTGEYVTAVVKAVNDSKGKIKAVAGIDISLKHLSDIIQGIRIGKTGYLILAQNDGTILAHPVKPELISKKAADTGIPAIEQFLSCRNGVTYYTFEGKRKMASFYNSPHTNWILIAVIEMSEVEASGSQVRNGIFITAIMILIFCMILYLYIMKRIINPVRELTDFGHSIAGGNLDTPIYMNRNDELGRLAEDFNKMMRRLRESIDSVKSIIETMPSIIIQLDTGGRIIEWNRQAREFAGISLDEAKGGLLSEVKPEISAYLKNFDEIIEFEKPVSFYRIKITGFEEHYFNLFIFLLKTEHSRSLVLRIDDITEFEKKDEQIRHIQKMESIGLLVSGIAHDFNNILGGILATVSLLNYRIKKGRIVRLEETSAELDLVEKSCQTGAAIAAQLLNLSKKESDLELLRADLNDVVSQIVKICRKSFDKSIDIRLYPYEGEAPAMINSAQIQQSILNLCINAAHAMTTMKKQGEHQGGHLDIGIMKINSDTLFVNSHYGANPGLYWQIFVKDSGVGMDKVTISKIFDPFFTTKTGGSQQGTGLGLSIVYSIIKDHGGFVNVYSEPGLGSKFTVYIPAITDDTPAANASPEREICTGEGTILIIDDEDTIRDYTEQILKECGYSVLTAASGSDGVNLYRQEISRINAVILDMVMPEKPGIEILDELIQINHEVKVLMTSGFHSKEIIEKAMNAGACGFIGKPYTMIQLSEKIR